MPRTYIALDLETTGLNPERDAIIEVGAVKFREGEPVEEFSALVNPGRPIPHEVQQLTGITDADVIHQPKFNAIAGQVMRFVGPLPVVGHNVSFDLGFLRAQSLLTENRGLDTWELASVVLPGRSSYSLGALVAYLGLTLENAHRALHDARATGYLFQKLCEQVAALPRPVLIEINRLARTGDWALAGVFEEALGGQGIIPRSQVVEQKLEQLAPQSPLLQPLKTGEPLVPREHSDPIDVDELAAMLRPEGAVGQAFSSYEFRPPQVDMLAAVGQAFNEQHHLLAEAGTGTGKSLAYLLPAIAYAVRNKTRVVVSTNTINLQDQLFKKDLPDLERILTAAWGPEPFRAALLKGRSNYLCLRRFNALKNRPNLTNEELRGIARILIWLGQTQTGDQSELSLPLASDRFVWSQVAADNEGCTLDRCQREQGGRCFFYRARRQADAAHVLVVNHSLLMADARAENRVLPEYHHLVIDEAHQLETAVTEQLSFRADAFTLAQQFTALHSAGGKSGLLADVLASLRRNVPDELASLIRDQVARVQALIETCQARLDNFWDVLGDVLRGLEAQPDNGDYDMRMRITNSLRGQPAWVEVEVSWDNLSAQWLSALRGLATLVGGLQDLTEGGFGPSSLEGLTESIGTIEMRLTELREQLEQWAVKPDHNGIYWVEVSAQSSRLTLRSAPLNVGPLVQEHILFRSDTVIMTSATLRTGGSFDYVRDRLQADAADTVTVGSPFDYKSCTLLYLPADLPEPNAPAYQRAVEQTLVGLAKALDGRTLALFTSYAQLKRTAAAITPALTEAKITVLSQGGAGSRHQLLEVFKNSTRTILLGTRSFWEGVDVIGPALSALVLVRLPFAVPSDPVVAARSETFDDPFYQYSVPDAILRFRQGFGRLIRSKTDRGVVVVLDKRVQSKTYGQLFLDSLPECTVHRGPLMNLPSAARTWVDDGHDGAALDGPAA